MKVYELLAELMDAGAGYEIRFVNPKTGEVYDLTGETETDTSEREYAYLLQPTPIEEG